MEQSVIDFLKELISLKIMENVILVIQHATKEEIDKMLQTLETYIKLAVDINKGILDGGGTVILFHQNQERTFKSLISDTLPNVNLISLPKASYSGLSNICKLFES